MSSSANTAVGLSLGITRTKKTAIALLSVVFRAASARYSARRRVLRAVALRASDLGTTAALRKPLPDMVEESKNLTCKCVERSDLPVFSTCSTSAVRRRLLLVSIAQEGWAYALYYTD